MTLWGATRHYLTHRRAAGEFTRTTAVTTGGILARFARTVGPDLPIRRLHRRHVERWLTTRTVAPATLRIEVSNVRTFSRWAVDHRLLERDPTAGIRGPRAPRPVPRHLDRDAIARTLAAADARTRLVVVLMVQLGLRRVEVARLEAGDFRDGLVLVRGKGDVQRWLPITAEVARALVEYRAAWPMTAGPLIRSYQHPARGLSAQHVGWLVTEAMKSAGVKRCAWDGMSAHPLRHTAAVDLFDQGATLLQVQDILGHAKASTTSIYLRRRHAAGDLAMVMEGRQYAALDLRRQPA